MVTACLCGRCTPNHLCFSVAYDPVASSIAYFSRRFLFTVAAVIRCHWLVANGQPKSRYGPRIRELLDRKTVNDSRRPLFSAPRSSQLFDPSLQGFDG